MSLPVLVSLLALVVLVPVLVVGLVLLRGSREDHFPAPAADPRSAGEAAPNPRSEQPPAPSSPREVRGMVDVTLTEPLRDDLGVMIQDVGVAAVAPRECDAGQAFVSVRVCRAGRSPVRVECELGTMFVSPRNPEIALVAPRSGEFPITGERATLVIEALALGPGKALPPKAARKSVRVDGITRKRDVLRLFAVAAEIEDSFASAVEPAQPADDVAAPLDDAAAQGKIDQLREACRLAARPSGGRRARLLPGVLICALWQVTAGVDLETYLRAVGASSAQERRHALRSAEFARVLLDIAGIAPTIIPQ